VVVAGASETCRYGRKRSIGTGTMSVELGSLEIPEIGVLVDYDLELLVYGLTVGEEVIEVLLAPTSAKKGGPDRGLPSRCLRFRAGS
jgi:hypothetical protein